MQVVDTARSGVFGICKHKLEFWAVIVNGKLVTTRWSEPAAEQEYQRELVKANNPAPVEVTVAPKIPRWKQRNSSY